MKQGGSGQEQSEVFLLAVVLPRVLPWSESLTTSTD